MQFWLLVLILVTLIALCWGSGYGLYRGLPDGRGAPWGGLLGLLGLILFIVLVIAFIGDVGIARPH